MCLGFRGWPWAVNMLLRPRQSCSASGSSKANNSFPYRVSAMQRLQKAIIGKTTFRQMRDVPSGGAVVDATIGSYAVTCLGQLCEVREVQWSILYVWSCE